MMSPGDGRSSTAIGVLGVPSSAGARQLGQESAPMLFRKVGLLDALSALDVEIRDYGDLPTVSFRPDLAHPRAQNLATVAAVARDVAERVSSIEADGAFPVILGGDCTITIGVVAGLTREVDDLGLMYFDGDIDLHTPESTSTGIFDGMGMAHILGRGAEELSGIGRRTPLLDERRVALFGYQDALPDDEEHASVSSTGMILFPRSQLGERPEEGAEEALAELQRNADRYIVHFDVDVVHHSDLPVADVPHFGGVSLDESERCLAVFLAGPMAAAFVLTEFNALQDPQGDIARDIVERVTRCLRPRFEKSARPIGEADGSGVPTKGGSR
jgi:arginase